MISEQEIKKMYCDCIDCLVVYIPSNINDRDFLLGQISALAMILGLSKAQTFEDIKNASKEKLKTASNYAEMLKNWNNT